MTHPSQLIPALTDIVINNMRGLGNTLISITLHPTDATILDSTTGKMIERYRHEDDPKRQMEPGQEKMYSLVHSLASMYVHAKEAVFHPIRTVYIDPDTFEVTPKNKKDGDYQ